MSESSIEKAFKEGVISTLFYINADVDDGDREQIADTLWESDGEAILLLIAGPTSKDTSE